MMHLSVREFTSRHTKPEAAFEMIIEGDCGVFNPRLIDLFSMMRMELEEVHEEIMRKKG